MARTAIKTMKVSFVLKLTFMNEFMKNNDIPDCDEYSAFFQEHLTNEKIGDEKISGLKLEKKEFAELACILRRNAENIIDCNFNAESIMHSLMLNAEHVLEVEWYEEEQRLKPDPDENVENVFCDRFPIEAVVSIQTETGILITEDYGNCTYDDLPRHCDEAMVSRAYYDPVSRLGVILING